MVRLTRDHNYHLELMERVGQKMMTKKQADEHPQKEALISYIGMDGLKVVDKSIKGFGLVTGDVIIMCSDGLYRALSDTEMSTVISTSKNTQHAADRLTHEAYMKGYDHQDNTTVVLLNYKD